MTTTQDGIRDLAHIHCECDEFAKVETGIEPRLRSYFAIYGRVISRSVKLCGQNDLRRRVVAARPW